MAMVPGARVVEPVVCLRRIGIGVTVGRRTITHISDRIAVGVFLTRVGCVGAVVELEADPIAVVGIVLRAGDNP
jgi:hypothetical protein